MPTAIENWTLVSRLFDEAADLEPSSRAAFLDLRCGDAAVRARVEALLRADQHTTPLLLDPRAALAPALWLDLEAEESARPEFPPTLGHFRILGELGRGGMGRVLRARDERLQRDVALKVVSDIADPRARERLLREARNASALRHPHIVTVFDVGAADGIDFIALELVEGKTLASLIPKGGLAVPGAVAWARQITDALAAAHASGIVHRDLKSQNVMIGADGAVKVLDFGIARRVDEGHVSESGEGFGALDIGVSALFGTPSAMSPEQAAGQAMDARSDVFSFGSLLYEMLTGRSPFRRDSAEHTRRAVLESTPPRLTTLRPGVPRRLSNLAARCLAKDPALRPADGAAVRAELDRFAGDLSALPRKRWLLAGIVAAALALGAAWFPWPKPSRLAADQFALLWPDAGGRPQSAPSFSPDGRSVAYVQPDAQGIAQVWIRPAAGGDARMLTSFPRPVRRPRWSPRGDVIAFDLAGIGIWTVEPAGSTPRQILPRGRDVSFSPDASQIAFDLEGAYSVAHADGTDAHPLPGLERSLWTNGFASFSPDGKQLAFFRPKVGPFGDVWLYGLETAELRQLTFDGAEGGDPTWTPDGRSIIYSSARGGATNLWRFDLANGRLTALTTGAGEDVQAEISRDGRRLLYATARDSFALSSLDPRTGARSELLERRQQITHPSFSPDGQSLVYFSEDRVLWILGLGGGNETPRQLSPAGELAILPEWSPDGQHIDYYARAGATAPGLRTLRPDGRGSTVLIDGFDFEHQHGAILDPQRRRAVYTAMDAQTPIATRVRDLATSQEHALLEPILWPRWSPDGKRLAGRSKDGSLSLCDAESGACHLLSPHGAEPRWVENGRALYFVRYADILTSYEDAELWRIDADGTQERKLATLPGSAHPLSFFYDVDKNGRVVWCEYRPGTREIWRAELH